MENLLDDARCGTLRLTSDIINLFLESKDIMQDQLDAYKSSQEPDEQSFQYICEALRQIALQNKSGAAATASTEPEQATTSASVEAGADQGCLTVTLMKIRIRRRGCWPMSWRISAPSSASNSRATGWR